MVLIREFYRLLYDSVEYMKQFTELSSKRSMIEKKISSSMDNQLDNNISMSNNIEDLFKLNDKDVEYLAYFLILGVLVHEGMPMIEAYELTISKFDNYVERVLSKKLMCMKYFRKLNNHEYEMIKTIKDILIK